MSVGSRIKKMRMSAGMTQADLASALNVPFQSISQWERDIRNPKVETLEKIASALNCSPYYLRTGEQGLRIKDVLERPVTPPDNAQAQAERDKRLLRAFHPMCVENQELAIRLVEAITPDDED